MKAEDTTKVYLRLNGTVTAQELAQALLCMGFEVLRVQTHVRFVGGTPPDTLWVKQ